MLNQLKLIINVISMVIITLKIRSFNKTVNFQKYLIYIH